MNSPSERGGPRLRAGLRVTYLATVKSGLGRWACKASQLPQPPGISHRTHDQGTISQIGKLRRPPISNIILPDTSPATAGLTRQPALSCPEHLHHAHTPKVEGEVRQKPMPIIFEQLNLSMSMPHNSQNVE